VPMIDINLCMEMKEAIPSLDIEHRVQQSIDLVLEIFLDPRGFLCEAVSEEGIDCFETRLINPGHSIEALWFIMQVAHTRGDQVLVNKTIDSIIFTLNYAWDKEYGGIFYFMDKDGRPPQQLEWDQKLWWVHLETLVGLALAFCITKRNDVAEWYQKVHDYTWTHFHDSKNGEWFGYLNRRGEVLLQLKGGKWKGFFHVPRALLLCANFFSQVDP